MLFGPERNQRRPEVVADGGEPVHPGVAGGTESDEPFPDVMAGAAVVHMDPPRIGMRRRTALAAKPVAEQNGLAVSTEAGLRVAETRLAGRADLGAGGVGGAARTEQPPLPDSRRPERRYGGKRWKCPALWSCGCQARIIPEKYPYR